MEGMLFGIFHGSTFNDHLDELVERLREASLNAFMVTPPLRVSGYKLKTLPTWLDMA